MAQRKSSTTSTRPSSNDPAPRTWVTRWHHEMISGVGVASAAVLALVACFLGYLPVFGGQFPFAAAVILSVVSLPVFAYFCFLAIRRLRWEHRNGGILKNSLSGAGIVLAVFVVAIGVIALALL